MAGESGIDWFAQSAADNADRPLSSTAEREG
jgi:hypothetical protein